MGNKYIDTEAPWALKKTNPERMKTVLYVLTEMLRRLAIILEPIMPVSCAKLLDQVGASEEMRTFDSIFTRITPGCVMSPPSPIFPKIESPK
jgi:methionyl-tRNA synthetase